MGGGRTTPRGGGTPDEESATDQDFSKLSSPSRSPSNHPRVDLSGKFEDLIGNMKDGLVGEGFEDVGRRISASSLDFEANQRKRWNTYKEVLKSYEQMRIRSENLEQAKSKILSYTPGAWIEKVSGMELSDYDVPETTTLLLVGPKGSGKSSLVNKISKVFEDDKFSPARAQVSYNRSAGDGTYFFQEYMIPRGSTSFCLYDTRGLSDNSFDNIEMLTEWITEGVHHRKVIIRPSDSESLRKRLARKAGEYGYCSESRTIDFVIFVVNALDVLKSMDSDVQEGSQYTQIIAESFNCPYLSFKDDRPAVVVTKGDLLSVTDRARVRVHLGELLGVPPAEQIFDIPESCDPVTELTIVDMLRYSLQHADKNLPLYDRSANKEGFAATFVSLFVIVVSLFVVVVVTILVFYFETSIPNRSHPRGSHKLKSDFDWGSIRHLWLE